jgi:hypothetical protein
MVLAVSRTLAVGLHPALSVSRIQGSDQTHALSPARVIFLVVIVVFFCLLFIGSYVWMRRPSFGQRGGRPRSGVVEANGVENEG